MLRHSAWLSKARTAGVAKPCSRVKLVSGPGIGMAVPAFTNIGGAGYASEAFVVQIVYFHLEGVGLVIGC